MTFQSQGLFEKSLPTFAMLSPTTPGMSSAVIGKSYLEVFGNWLSSFCLR